MKQSAYSDIVSDGGMDPRNIKSAPQAHSMTPLYKKPQWQGLTFADIDDLAVSLDWVAGARWAEAKLKEKNGD